MYKKKMRVIIADESPFHLREIERNFNRAGCYGVVPVRAFGELLTLCHYATKPFDLLVFNKDVFKEQDISIARFLQESKMLKHVMTYKPSEAFRSFTETADARSIYCHASVTPNEQLIDELLAVIVSYSLSSELGQIGLEADSFLS